MTDPKCKHETLRFGSGGYYVFCETCHVRWVAIKGGPDDTELDRDRAGDGLTADELRIDWPA